MPAETFRWGQQEPTWGNPDWVWGSGPQSVPGKPGAPSVFPRDTQIETHWAAPDAGSSPITRYDLEVSQQLPDVWQRFPVDGHVRYYRFRGLTNGTAARVRVRAINSVGAGPYSDVSSVTPVADLVRIRRWRLRASFQHGPQDDLVFDPTQLAWVDITGDVARWRIRYGAEREIALTTGSIELRRGENRFNTLDSNARHRVGRMYIELAFDHGAGLEIYDFYTGLHSGSSIDVRGFGQIWRSLGAGDAGDTISLRTLLETLRSPEAAAATAQEFTLSQDGVFTWTVLRQLVNWFGGNVIDFYGGQSIPEEPARVGQAEVGEAIVGVSTRAAGPAFARYVKRSDYGSGDADIVLAGSDNQGYGCTGLSLTERKLVTHVVGRDGTVAETVYAGLYERREFRLDTRYGGVTASQVADTLNIQEDIWRTQIVAGPIIQPHAVLEVLPQSSPWHELPPVKGTVVSMLISNDGPVVNYGLSIASRIVQADAALVGKARVGVAEVGVAV